MEKTTLFRGGPAGSAVWTGVGACYADAETDAVEYGDAVVRVELASDAVVLDLTGQDWARFEDVVGADVVLDARAERMEMYEVWERDSGAVAEIIVAAGYTHVRYDDYWPAGCITTVRLGAGQDLYEEMDG